MATEREKVIERIEYFKTLTYNWNGYGALAFSEKLINKAIDLAKQLKPIPKVFPTGGNSIQFEWEKEDLYLEMEVFEDSIKIFNCKDGFKENGICSDDYDDNEEENVYGLPKHHPQYGGTLAFYKDLPVGTEFHVYNGVWDGKIIEEDGVKKVYVYETYRAHVITDDDHAWI